MTPSAGRRGSRSASPPLRAKLPAVVRESRPSPSVAAALPAAPRPHPGRVWIGLVAGLAAGVLLGDLVLSALRHEPIGASFGAVWLHVLGIAAAVGLVLCRRAMSGRRGAAAVAPPTPEPPSPVRPTELDQGVLDIRRTDRGFDAARFAGYAAMMFRDVQSAGMAGDATVLRDRVTPAMYAELEARCSRLRTSGRSPRVEAVDVTSEVTEAWQDGNRDYVTAYVAGSMQSHTRDDGAGRIVEGSPGLPLPVEAFLTFTRPAGLNFWMLSLIQPG
jgi:predicted lipid-binding transport protein (Tim44 family)